MGDTEIGTCDICLAMEVPLLRRYYYYPVKCECCNGKDDNHFEIVKHCSTCNPLPPKKVVLVIKPIKNQF